MNVNKLPVLLAALAAPMPAGAAAVLTPCHLPQLAERGECGAIDVPEDRS